MLKLNSTLFGVVVGISLKAFGNLYLLYSIVLSEMGRKHEKVKQTSQCLRPVNVEMLETYRHDMNGVNCGKLITMVAG